MLTEGDVQHLLVHIIQQDNIWQALFFESRDKK